MAQAPVTNLEEALTAILAGDPIARSPKLPPVEVLGPVDHGADLVAFAEAVKRVETGEGGPGQELGRMAWHGDGPTVPLARGYLWRQAENRLGGLVSQDDGDTLVDLVTPLRTVPTDAAHARDPLSFLIDEGARRVYGERQVLEGWLAGPGIPSGPVVRALQGPATTRLAGSPAGRLLAARTARGEVGEGFALLERATLLSLTRTAADRDGEQAAWADMLLAAREELGTEDPEGALLDAAFESLLAGAADDEVAGAALVALAGRRWLGRCADVPCDGLDRTALFTAARGYGGRADALARVWAVVALKDAMDGMDAGHDTVVYPKAALQLLDALHGTGAGPLDASVLMKNRADAGTWLSLSRAVGGDGATDWGSAREALVGHATTIVDDALAVHQDGPLKPLLTRVRSRLAR